MYKTLPEEDSTKLPLSRALLWILISTLLISGTAFMGWLYYLHLQERRLQDEQYRIVALVQRTSPHDRLKTSYLAELLDLSLERPLNLYQFNAREAEKRLNTSPLIKQSTIRKVRPGTLYIDYQLRVPIAYVGDYTNTVVDEQGVLFPYQPFFSPKPLPTLYLGLNTGEAKWGDSLKDRETMRLAFAFLEQFKKLNLNQFFLKQVDVIQADADSYGQRQIVIILENIAQESLHKQQDIWYLRLNPDHYQKNLTHFKRLISQEAQIQRLNLNRKKQSILVDLRLPFLAFIKQDE
jgi:hypothetical protein